MRRKFIELECHVDCRELVGCCSWRVLEETAALFQVQLRLDRPVERPIEPSSSGVGSLSVWQSQSRQA